jgi:hypothetical protein
MATKEFNISSNAVTVLNQTSDAAENTTKAFTSAKAELRALQQQLLTMDQSSDAFKKASARAAELKDSIGDLSAEINANAGNAFEGLSNNVGLFGSRLMSLDLKGAGQALRGMGSAVSKIDFKTLKDEVGGLAKGLVDLGVSVVSNPFFLLGAALVGLIAYWDELKSAVQTYTLTYEDSMDRMNKSQAMQTATKDVAIQTAQIELLIRTVNDHSKSEEDRKKALEKVNTALEANGIATINDINATGQVIVAKDALIKKLQQEAKVRGKLAYLEELYAKQVKLQAGVGTMTELSAANKMITDQLGGVGKLMQTSTDFLTSGMGTTVTDLQNIQKEIEMISESVYNDQEALNALQITGLTNSDAESAKASKDAAAKAAEESKRKRTEAQKAQEQLLEDNAVRAARELKIEKELAAEKLKVQQEYIKANQSAQANELYELELKKEKELQTWEGAEEDKVLIIEKYRLAEIDINTKYDDLALEQQIAFNEKKKAEDEKAAADAKDAQDKLNEKNAIAAAKELTELKKAEDAKAALRVDAMKTSLSIIGDLAGAFAGQSERQQKKAFEIQKGVSIATATIDTYLAAQGAYRSQMAILTPDAPVRAAVAAGIAIASGLARVAIISKQQFKGSGGTSGGGGGSSSMPNSGGGGTEAPSPANFAFLGNQPNQQPPLQAYVVSGQVSSNLEAQQLIQNQSRLGG